MELEEEPQWREEPGECKRLRRSPHSAGIARKAEAMSKAVLHDLCVSVCVCVWVGDHNVVYMIVVGLYSSHNI